MPNSSSKMKNLQDNDDTYSGNEVDDTNLDGFLEKTIYRTLRIFFIYQYLLMLMIVIIVFLLCKG